VGSRQVGRVGCRTLVHSPRRAAGLVLGRRPGLSPLGAGPATSTLGDGSEEGEGGGSRLGSVLAGRRATMAGAPGMRGRVRELRPELRLRGPLPHQPRPTTLVLSVGQLIAASGLLVLAAPFGGFTPPTWRADAIAALLILRVIGTGVAYVINHRIISDDGPYSCPP
jgi:hypothetical protein